jgi:hypothetical protein
MARWDTRKHPRDKYGRFTDSGVRGGSVLKAVRGGRSKIINKNSDSVRARSASLRHGGYQNRMIAQGRDPYGLSAAQIRRLAIGSGMRRRGQVVRSIERVNRVVVVPTSKVRRSRAVRRRSR